MSNRDFENNVVNYTMRFTPEEYERFCVIGQIEHKVKSKLIKEMIEDRYKHLVEHLLEL